MITHFVLQFQSNITTVQAQCTDKEGKNWTFNIRPHTLENAECFARISEPSSSTGILVELSMVYTKEVCSEPLHYYWFILVLLNGIQECDA